MGYEVKIGDCLDELRKLPDRIADTCITSPPYYGLRDYGVSGQIGLEPTLDEYIESLVEICREVRRVLKDDGTLWLNIGDSYAGSGKGRNSDGSHSADGDGSKQSTSRGTTIGSGSKSGHDGFKPKDLMMVPARLAIALQADGWYLRQDIIWAKPNCMPEPVKDRMVKSHEYIFLLSKSRNYYFDYEAILEPMTSTRLPGPGGRDLKKAYGMGGGSEGRFKMKEQMKKGKNTRRKRSVWWVSPISYSGAHFAVFPPDLIEPCVLAGSRKGGIVLDPFAGSGTTLGVAVRSGRSAIGIELNKEYAGLIDDRVDAICGMKVGRDGSVPQKQKFDSWFGDEEE